MLSSECEAAPSDCPEKISKKNYFITSLFLLNGLFFFNDLTGANVTFSSLGSLVMALPPLLEVVVAGGSVSLNVAVGSMVVEIRLTVVPPPA